MNELTPEAIRAVEQTRHKIARLSAWAARWRGLFGACPQSHPGKRVAIKGRAAIEHETPGPASQQMANILMHPALFERHGNQGRVRFPRRRGQLNVRGRLPKPPEAA